MREAFPELQPVVDALLGQMNFSIFYDDRPEAQCNTNPALPRNQPTGQMFGGYMAQPGPPSGPAPNLTPTTNTLGLLKVNP